MVRGFYREIRRGGVVLVLVFSSLLLLIINSSISSTPLINTAFTDTLVEDVKKTPNKWEKLTNVPQPDVGYAHVYNESIYFIGKDAVQVYDPLTNTWEIIKNTGLPGAHTSGGSALLGDRIYFIYGWSNARYYDISENKFIQFDRSSFPRTDVAVAELGGLIYISGGWISDDPTSLVLVEVYDPKTESWNNVASMNVGRKRHEMVTLDRYLYVIGGEIEESFIDTTKSVERYNPNTNSWEIVNVPTYSYSNFGVTATDNHNFVVTHFTTEVYNTSSGTWLRGPDLFPTFRDILHPALTYYNGCVYVVGGQRFIEGTDCFNSVYRWNIRTHKFGDTVPDFEMSSILIAIGSGVVVLFIFIFYHQRRRVDRPFTPRFKVDGQSIPKFCSNCGNLKLEGSKYCIHCGIELPLIREAPQTLETSRLLLSEGDNIAKKQNELIDLAQQLDSSDPEATKWNNWFTQQTARYKNLDLSKDSYQLMLTEYEKFLKKQKMD